MFFWKLDNNSRNPVWFHELVGYQRFPKGLEVLKHNRHCVLTKVQRQTGSGDTAKGLQQTGKHAGLISQQPEKAPKAGITLSICAYLCVGEGGNTKQTGIKFRTKQQQLKTNKLHRQH